jgi:hypothetical protein
MSADKADLPKMSKVCLGNGIRSVISTIPTEG